MTVPGIYTGVVNVEYNNKTTEKYVITLRKLPSDTVEFTAELKAAVLQIHNFSINNNAGDKLKVEDKDLPRQDVINKVILEVDGVQKEATLGEFTGNVQNQDGSMQQVTQNIYTVDLTDLKDINENSKVKLTIQYLNGYEFVSDLFVERDQNGKARALRTNQEDLTQKSQLDLLAVALGVDSRDLSVSPSRITPGTQDYTVMNNGKELFTYRQTYSNSKDGLTPTGQDYGAGGPRFDINNKNNTNNLEVKFYTTNSVPTGQSPPSSLTESSNFLTDRPTFKNPSSSSTGQQNTTIDKKSFPSLFLPSVGVFYGQGVDNEKTRDYTLIGDYYVTFSEDGREVAKYKFSDPMANAQISSLNGGKFSITGASGSGRISVIVQGKEKVTIPIGNGQNYEKEKSYFTVNLGKKEDLKHGITVFNVKFNVDEQSIKDDYNKIKNTVPNANIETFEEPIRNTNNNVESTLIVAFDKYNAASTQVSFKVTDSRTGQLTFKNGKDKLGSTTPSLDINGAGITKSTVSGNDVIFDVVFLDEIPMSFDYELRGNSKTIKGKVDTGRVEAVNVTIGETDNTGLENVDKFRVNAKFSNAGEGKLMINNFLTDIIDYKELYKEGNSFGISVDKGKYQGFYKAGFILQKSRMGIQIKKHESTSPNSISLLLDASYFGEGDEFKSNVAGTLEYKKSDSTAWEKLSDINQDIVKNENEVYLNVNDAKLESGKSYDFRVKYVYTNPKDKNDTSVSYSNVVTQVIATSSTGSNAPGGSGPISGSGGGSSSSTTGSSTGSTTINTTTSNTIKGNTDVTITLPSGVKYDNNRTPVAINFKYKGKDGKIVTEKREEFSNVKASFDGDKVKIEGLVPGKEYTEIHVDYTDNNGKTKTLLLKNIKVESNVESEKYLSNVYSVVFNRPADESGYHFHLGNLKGKKVSIREFLLNMLTEKEFIETYKTTESKIEALYSGIVGRESDAQGKDFWVSEYKKLLSVYGNEASTLKAIADRMVNEKELKELADKMGILY